MSDFAPVGVQMTFANSSNVSQVHQNLNNAIALQQDIETGRQKKDDELKQSQVRNKDDSEGGTIQDDPDRRSRNGYYYRASQRQEDDEEESFAVDPKRGRLLDFSI
ncbi:MAG: hypothetical protein IKZ58_04725 [Selenomonadaceae bacterium]|nr:hypothetical protein [Selenomonadaceae bacterium]